MTTKNILTMAALALMTIACSNEDEVYMTPYQSVDNSNNKEEITITATLAPKGNDGMRAVSDNGTKIVSTWAKNEHIAILYEVSSVKKVADATITAVDGTGAATISFSVDGSTTDNTNCQIIYPYDAAKDDNSGVKAYADMLATQDGVLDGDLDVRVGAGKIQVTTPSLDVTTQPAAQYSIFKFTIQNLSSTAKTATEFKVSDNSGNVITTVTPGSATGTLYVALPALATGLYWFNATIDSKAYIANANISTATTTGKYYQSTIKFATIGDVILSNGKFATKGTSGEQAVIAYVGKVDNYFDKFLALALTDADDNKITLATARTAVNTYAGSHAITIGSTPYNTSTTGSTYYDMVSDNHSTTSATATSKQTGWRIPSVTDWRYILDGICTQMNGVNLWARSFDLSYSVPTVTPTNPLGISDQMSYTSNTHSSYNALNSACGNTALKNNKGYWSCSRYPDASDKWWYYHIYDGVFAWAYQSGDFYVRACFAF